jgi:hypothetical protein
VGGAFAVDLKIEVVDEDVFMALRDANAVWNNPDGVLRL